MPATAHNNDRAPPKKFIGAVKDEWQLYSNTASDYTIGPPIGFGASSVVYTAQYHPPGESQSTPCALKVLDLDRLPPRSLHLLQRETQLMSLSKHPNVLRVRGTWTEGHKLYIALRLMKSGSAADVMHYGWAGGMEEEVVRCILKQALEGLNYLHVNGLMHRDIKAANMLIDDDGTVLLGDLGVAAFLWENEDITHAPTAPSLSSGYPSKNIINHRPTASSHHHHHLHHHHHRPRVLGKRKSFVGTPCWMAPEVINGKQYDASADIWSFGITALELAQGRAPRSRESPHNVLLHIVQDAPPKLDREGGPYKYSRTFAEIVEQCLNKEPSQRPTAEDLLQSSFFKGAKKKGYLVNTILKDLPPLTQRQERRKQPSIMTHHSIESWDFSLSPTTSVYSHHPHRPLSTLPTVDVLEHPPPSHSRDGSTENGNRSQLPSENREHEEGAAAYAQRMRTRHNTTQHAPRPHPGSGTFSRSVSWVGETKRDRDAADDRTEPDSSENSTKSSSAERSDAPDAPSSSSSESGSILPSSKATDGTSMSSAPSSIHKIGAKATSRPVDVPADRKTTAPIAGSPSSVGSSSDSGPSSLPGSTPSRLWKKLTGRVGTIEDKEGMRSKAKNGVAELVKTVSRTRTASATVSSKNAK